MKTMGPCTRAAVLQHHTTLAGRQSPHALQINAIGSVQPVLQSNPCRTANAEPWGATGVRRCTIRHAVHRDGLGDWIWRMMMSTRPPRRRSDKARDGNLTGVECAALSGLKADGPGRPRDPLRLMLGKLPPVFRPGHSVSLPHLGTVHLHQLTQITSLLGKAQGVSFLPARVPYLGRRLRLGDHCAA
jgi:hypothetical protein